MNLLIILFLLNTSFIFAIENDATAFAIPVRVQFDGGDAARELGKGLAQGISELGNAMSRGTKTWSDDARITGKNVANAQEAFFHEYADGMEKGTAPHLRRMQRSFVTSLIHPSDVAQYAATIGMGIVITTSCYFVGKIVWQAVETLVNKYLKKPRVLISRRVGAWDRFKSWWRGDKAPEMVLDQSVKERLEKIVQATKITNKRLRQRKTTAKYRNIMLYGPPGTGKTMFARSLAYESGMDFVETTGGSFFQEGAGIAAIDELFDWANRNKRMIIFIDEADSLFVDRSLLKPGSEEHRIVNHFLNRLGQNSDRFLLVVATNHKSVFDRAMHRRIHEFVPMILPSLTTRIELLKLYIKNILSDVRKNGLLYVQKVKALFTDEYIYHIAQQTERLSHADIACIINSIQSDSQISEDGLPSKEIIDATVKQYIQKNISLNDDTITSFN